jgi:hypothetical protein
MLKGLEKIASFFFDYLRWICVFLTDGIQALICLNYRKNKAKMDSQRLGGWVFERI